MSTPPTPPVAEPQPQPQKMRYRVKMRNPQGHPGQMELWGATKKRIIIRAGRRGGKTTGASMKAVQAFVVHGKRVLYACPTLDQVQKFWKEVKLALDEPLAYGAYYKNETEHVIEKRGTEARIRAKTAWNAETLRGDYADLLILDEWQMMDETAWTEVGSPMLIDNNGDVVFIYTPPSLESRSASKARDPQHAAKMYKQRKDDPNWLCIHFPSHQNPHISEEGLDEVSKNMTALAYRQEILALDTDEVPGALWTRKILEDTRVHGMPCDARRVVVGVDPSGGNVTEVGIMTAAEGADGHIYVLRDSSMKAPKPRDWAQRAINVYHELQADRILGERNYGGDMVEETIRNVEESVSYYGVNATRGKMVRAEPVLALFQQNKMHLVCNCGKNPCAEFEELEEELCSYTADPRQKSPNRMDAMVWCGIELSGAGSLGLLDLFKSGRAHRLLESKPMTKTQSGGAITKIQGAGNLAAVATNDQTPRCPQCQNVAGLNVIGGGQMRCQACGHQWWAGKPPVVDYPRRVTMRK